MTEERLTESLNEALERLAAGATVEECLATHPEVAGELEPLLRVAQATMTVVPAPRPEARQRILARLAETWQERESRRGRRRFSFLGPLFRPWAATLVGVLALTLAGLGATSAAADSLPGDLLYPVKTARERLILAVSPSSDAKARIHARLAAERAQEMDGLTARDHNIAQLERVALRMASHSRQAVLLVGGHLPALSGILKVSAASDAAVTAESIQSAATAPPPQLRPPPTAEPQPVNRALRKQRQVRVEVRRLLASQEEQQAMRFQRLPRAKQQQYREAFQQSRQELQRAIHALEELEKEDDSSGDDEDVDSPR